MKKRLLIATDAFLPRWDGISRYLNEVIDFLLDSYHITVIAPTFPEFANYHEPDLPYKIIRVPSYKWSLGDFHPPKFRFGTIFKAVKDADIVWTHALMPIGMLGILSANLQRKPVIATIHSIE